MAQRKKATPVIDEAALVEEVREELAREGAVKLSRIKPASVRGAVSEKLARDGVEVTGSVIRQPLRAQLLAALDHGALVPVKSLAAHVRGANATELKRMLDEAVRDGAVRRVLRGTAEVLAGPEVKVLSASEVKLIRSRLSELGKVLEKVTKKPGLSLLATDATTELAEAIAAVSGTQTATREPAPAAQASDAMVALLAAVDSTRDVRTGLSFVPAVVGRLAPALEASTAVKLLLAAAERELLELRPEGGIGRLSEAELSVCPAGPHGTRLSWARRLTGGAP